ncbi:Rgg family transcriptional regulator [Streptococcus orisasini]
MKEFGKIFKILRESKNLSLREASQDAISMAQLSRFERGQSSISIDSFFQCLDNINVLLDEFQSIYNDYTLTDDIRFNKELFEAYLNNDYLKLDKFLNDLEIEKIKYPDKKSLYLNSIIVKIIIYTCDQSRKVSKKDLNFLVDYLFSVEQWGRYELWLFINGASVFTINTLITLSSEMLGRVQFYDELLENRRKIYQMLLNVVTICIENDYLAHALKFMNSIDSLQLSEADVFERIVHRFNKAYYSFKRGDEASMELMLEYIEMLKKLDCLGAAEKLLSSISDFVNM